MGIRDIPNQLPMQIILAPISETTVHEPVNPTQTAILFGADGSPLDLENPTVPELDHEPEAEWLSDPVTEGDSFAVAFAKINARLAVLENELGG